MPWVDPVDGAPRRHARVWVDGASWQGGKTDAAVDDWIAKGRAVVVRRADAGSEGSCAVAIVLPLARGRRRIAFAVDPAAIVSIAPPLTLTDAIATAPHEWRPALCMLVARGARIGLDFRVYGSLAWQAISGERCVAPTSDVDLLWTAIDDDAIERGIALLAGWQAETGLRPDGEFLLSNGDGIAWRELASGARRVLVKHRDRVSLQPSPWRARTRAEVP